MWVSHFSFFCQGHIGKVLKKGVKGEKVSFRYTVFKSWVVLDIQ